jgi:hypothetical protein
LLSAVLVAAPGSAHAGRTFYGWLYGSEVMPERGVELQSWITEKNFGDDDVPPNKRETDWLFGAFIGVTDQLELGLPLEIDWIRDASGVSKTSFSRYGAELRYRFVTQDPVDAPAFVPLLRVGVKRLTGNRDAVRPEADLVLSYETGIVQVAADLGFVAEIESGTRVMELRPAAGVSVLAIEDFDMRFGAEVYAEIKDKSRPDWIIAGPNFSYTHGRFWLTAVYGIGLKGIGNAPRVQLGIAF